jgi:hypothetical protein
MIRIKIIDYKTNLWFALVIHGPKISTLALIDPAGEIEWI